MRPHIGFDEHKRQHVCKYKSQQVANRKHKSWNVQIETQSK